MEPTKVASAFLRKEVGGRTVARNPSQWSTLWKGVGVSLLFIGVCGGVFLWAMYDLLDFGDSTRERILDWDEGNVSIHLDEVAAGGATVGFFYEVLAQGKGSNESILLARFDAEKGVPPADSVSISAIRDVIYVNVRCRRNSRHQPECTVRGRKIVTRLTCR